MALLFVLMLAIRRHYDRVRRELAVAPRQRGAARCPPGCTRSSSCRKLHKPTLRALAYARASRPSVLEAVTVRGRPGGDRAAAGRSGTPRDIPVPLRALDSPVPRGHPPVIDYVRGIRRDSPRDLVVVFIPEYVVGHWWEQLLHNQSALRLKTRLHFTPGVMVASVPWQLALVQGLGGPGLDHAASGAPARHARAHRRRSSARRCPATDPARVPTGSAASPVPDRRRCRRWVGGDRAPPGDSSPGDGVGGVGADRRTRPDRPDPAVPMTPAVPALTAPPRGAPALAVPGRARTEPSCRLRDRPGGATAATAWRGTRAGSSSSGTRCPASWCASGSPRPASSDRFWRGDAVEVLERLARPGRAALPVARPGRVRRLRLAARRPRGAAPAEGRRASREQLRRLGGVDASDRGRVEVEAVPG